MNVTNIMNILRKAHETADVYVECSAGEGQVNKVIIEYEDNKDTVILRGE